MADIVFLLIIFFMLTTVFSDRKGFEIELPQTEYSESISPKNIIIRISSEGDVYLEGQKSELRKVGPYVLSERATSPNKGVILESDENVKYKHVMDVLDELLLVGVTDISLPTREEEGEEPLE
jgi:biopolymer transport protein ExbD